MRALFRYVAVLAFQMVCQHALALGCPAYDIETEFRESTAVFLGVVVSSVGVSGDIVSEFQIERSWKGEMTGPVTVTLENPVVIDGEEAMTSHLPAGPLVIGDRYIVLATDISAPRLMMAPCSYLRLKTEADEQAHAHESLLRKWLDSLDRLAGE